MKFERDMILKQVLVESAWNDEKGHPIDFEKELFDDMILTKTRMGEGTEIITLKITIGEVRRLLMNLTHANKQTLMNWGCGKGEE